MLTLSAEKGGCLQAVKRKERAEQLQEQEERIEPKRRRKGPRPVGGISGWSGFGGYGDGQHQKEMFSEARLGRGKGSWSSG